MSPNALAENIRTLRQQCRMTQAELAEKIGYSMKTVSKWELGDCEPSLEVLAQLADIFGTDMNALTGYAQKISYYLGIDGGATKTAFALCDEDGRVISSCRLSSCNPIDVGIAEAEAVLRDGILTVCKNIPRGKISVFAGISGGISGNNKDELCRFLSSFGFAVCENGSDLDNAVAVTLRGHDGIAAIMGTGSVAIAVKDGIRHRIGGYGYFFDDGGSGFDLGQKCLKSCLKAHDKSGKDTLLLKLCEEKLEMSIVESIGKIYQGGKAMIASFAPLVYEAYRKGDAVAAELIQSSMQNFAANIHAAAAYFPNESVNVCLVGGQCKDADSFLPILRSYLNNTVTVSVCRTPQFVGALNLAGYTKEIHYD